MIFHEFSYLILSLHKLVIFLNLLTNYVPVLGLNLQHQKIFQPLNIPFPQNYVNFKFYRLNQQEKNHNQPTWIAQSNEGTTSKLILQFVI